MCELHTDKVVEIYCYHHDAVCCAECMDINHTTCTNADYVSKIAVGFSKHPDVAKTKSNLHKIRKDLKAIKSSRKNDQTRNKLEKDHVLAQLQESRRRINAVFDKLEVSVIGGADSRYNLFVANIQTDMNACDAAINKIEQSMKVLEDTDTHNAAQMFVHVKTGKQNMEKWRMIASHIQDKIDKEKIVFNANGDIQTYLDQLENLGQFVDGYTEPGPSMMMLGENIRENPGTSVDTLKGTSILRTNVRKEDLMIDMDSYYGCDIRGSCCLPDGGALIPGFETEGCLILLNSAYQPTDRCDLAKPLSFDSSGGYSCSYPRGVCNIQGTHEAAVCVRGAIHIVSLGRQMKKVRTIRLSDMDFWSVAYCNGLLYVTGEEGNKLYVYDYATGQRTLTFDTDKYGQKIFSSTQHVATNAAGTRIWVADYLNGLIGLDNSNVVRVKLGEMGSILGVCLDNEDNVYVCGDKPRNVMQFSPNGDKFSTLLREDELPRTPSSISFDNKRSRLLVTMRNTNRIKVIHFT